MVVLVVFAVSCNLEPLEDPGLGQHGLTTIVYDSEGNILAEWHDGEDRVLTEIDRLPRHVLDAVVAIEDERFWEHQGVDVRGMARALIKNVEAGSVVQGGSTITQQYLKNVLLTPDQTVKRKLTEIASALRLEEGLTKEEILERYLNTAYFGDGAYGIETASLHYFGKPASELGLDEAALLAGLIKAPSNYDPYENPQAALERRQVVLDKMVELGWLAANDAQTAASRRLQLANPGGPDAMLHPYFTEEARRLLLEEPALGATATDRANMLYRGGLRIHTTLHPRTQQAAEEAIASVMDGQEPSAAIAVVDPRSGEVLALVGGENFFDPDNPVAQFNLATQAKRQPGSAFKPFVLAAALEAGITLDRTYPAPRTIEIKTDSGKWSVENYEGMAYPDLSVLEATVWSVNTVYAQLVQRIGPRSVVEVASAAGAGRDLEPLPSIALGAQELAPLDLASAYGTFAADGVHTQPILVTSIETADGVNIYQSTPVVTNALEPAIARQVTAALTEVVTRGTGRLAEIGRPLAGKTGTSQNHSDAWFVGYTPEVSAAVWVGFPESTKPMEYPNTPYSIGGGSWPAQIFAAFASGALGDTAYGRLAVSDPSGRLTVEVDTGTGYLAGPLCPRTDVQHIQFPVGKAPTVVCPFHNPTDVVNAGAGEVPDLTGLSLGDAVAELEQAGYLATVRWQAVSGMTDGIVLFQNPEPGSPAQVGSSILLTITGAEPGTVVPSVVGFPSGQAVSELAELGLIFDLIVQAEANPEDARRRSGVVWKQDPAGGSQPGDFVSLWVNP